MSISQTHSHHLSATFRIINLCEWGVNLVTKANSIVSSNHDAIIMMVARLGNCVRNNAGAASET